MDYAAFGDTMRPMSLEYESKPFDKNIPSESGETTDRSIADELNRLKQVAGDESITIRRLVEVLSDRGHALVILLLAAPFIVLPIPGLSTAVGLAICGLSVALILNRNPWLPGFVADRVISPDGLDRIIRAVTGVMKRLQKGVKPRMGFMTHGTGHRLAGVTMLLAAIAFGLPGPPGNNIPPAICLTVLALGLLERDGLLVIIGHILTIILWLAIIVLVIVFWKFISQWIHAHLGSGAPPTTLPATIPATQH
jgi:hypothetical protein